MVAPQNPIPPDYKKALEVLNKYRNLLSSLPDVQNTGLGRLGPKFCIQIGVTNKDSMILISNVLRRDIEGVPVSIDFSLPIQMAQGIEKPE